MHKNYPHTYSHFLLQNNRRSDNVYFGLSIILWHTEVDPVMVKTD